MWPTYSTGASLSGSTNTSSTGRGLQAPPLNQAHQCTFGRPGPRGADCQLCTYEEPHSLLAAFLCVLRNRVLRDENRSCLIIVWKMLNAMSFPDSSQYYPLACLSLLEILLPKKKKFNPV